MSLRPPIPSYIRRPTRLQCLRQAFLQRAFHASAARYADVLPNHYETLDLPPTATPAEIKKSFYALSKLHHPDHNPNDSTASARFVKISEAYHILGSPEKRTAYDRDFTRAHSPASSQHAYGHPLYRQGSHSSASNTPAGSRPASGLSRRRTQFRGPPPSFYRGGGYGAQHAKRSANAPGAGDAGSASGFGGPYAYAGAAGGETSGNSTFDSGTSGGGLGASSAYGAGTSGEYDPDIPHWDRAGHFRTHEGIRMRRQRSAGGSATGGEYEIGPGPSFLYSFVLVSGAMGIILFVAPLFFSVFESRPKKQRDNG